MTDWGIDPGALEQYAKAGAAVLDTLKKLRDTWSQRRKATGPENLRELAKELDALEAKLLEVVVLMTKQSKSHMEFVQSIVDVLGPLYTPEGFSQLVKFFQQFQLTKHSNAATEKLNEVVAGLERRLAALEHPPEDRGERVPKPKRRQIPKPERRRR